MVAVAFGACKNDNPEPIVPEPSDEELTADFITGIWSLSEWSAGLGEGIYCYIDMDGESGRYEMWDNLNSMYPQHTTGSFKLSKVDEHDYITGTYDNGVGEWNDSYEVVILSDQYIDWISQSTGEKMSFKRVMGLPELE